MIRRGQMYIPQGAHYDYGYMPPPKKRRRTAARKRTVKMFKVKASTAFWIGVSFGIASSVAVQYFTGALLGGMA